MKLLNEKMDKAGGFAKMDYKDQQRVRENFAKSDDYQTSSSIADYRNALNNYEQMVRKYGSGKISGVGKSRLESAYSDLAIKYKEAAKLGALTGPDIGLVHQGIAPAAGFASLVGGTFKGGQEGILNQIADLRAKTSVEAKGRLDSLRTTFPDGVDPQMNSLKKRLGLEEKGTKKAAPVPAVGSVVNGYIFNGGNPNDPKSWSKAI
jgi:hypothetical protein